MTNKKRKEVADAFGKDLDPLLKFEQTFVEYSLKPFEAALDDLIDYDTTPQGTISNYTTPIGQWKAFIKRHDRHPACPSERHVREFITYLRKERDNSDSTIKPKIRHLNSIFEYWQSDAAFPHDDGFNPFAKELKKGYLSPENAKEPPRVSVPELREKLQGVNHWRDRTVIVTQLKLGLRASELCNIKLSEINIQHQELQDHYDEIGTHRRVRDRPNSVYIPPDRELNKSSVPRVLPLDDELRLLLIEYLLVRPDNGKPWVFLSPTRHNQMNNSKVNEIWKDHFHPEYQMDEDDPYRSITSHFGRHRFSTHFRNERHWQEEKVQYMTGHKGSYDSDKHDSLSTYVHTYYEDIRDRYLDEIYKFGLGI
jgi:integrase/recombinase XerD